MYHEVKLILLISAQSVFTTLLRCTVQMIINGKICLDHTPEKFMVGVQIFPRVNYLDKLKVLSVLHFDQTLDVIFELLLKAIQFFLNY